MSQRTKRQNPHRACYLHTKSRARHMLSLESSRSIWECALDAVASSLTSAERDELWTSVMDSIPRNRSIRIPDLQALDSIPRSRYPEMTGFLSAYVTTAAMISNFERPAQVKHFPSDWRDQKFMLTLLAPAFQEFSWPCAISKSRRSYAKRPSEEAWLQALWGKSDWDIKGIYTLIDDSLSRSRTYAHLSTMICPRGKSLHQLRQLVDVINKQGSSSPPNRRESLASITKSPSNPLVSTETKADQASDMTPAEYEESEPPTS